MSEEYDSKVDASFDYMFKVLIVGNSAVGKTAFLVRYCDETFLSAFVSTVGIDFKVKTLIRNEKRIKLQIWDTAGQERYRTITTAYYRGAMGFIIMFDLTNEESFLAVKKWATQIQDLSWEKARTVLVGNKCDLASSRVVTQEQANDLAQSMGVKYFETSAKDDINVKQSFDALVDEISIKMAESVENNPKFTPGRPNPRPRDSDSTKNPSGQSSQCSC